MLCLVQCCWLEFLGDNNLTLSFLTILLLFLAPPLNTKLVS
jgi:hypothetical protein